MSTKKKLIEVVKKIADIEKEEKSKVWRPIQDN